MEVNVTEGKDGQTSITYRVPYADTDQMGVVYYANYLVYFERLRNELLRRRGMTYKALEEEGFFLPVVEAWCKYREPARYDDLLRIRGWIEPHSRTRIKICCRVEREEELLAEGYTVHACINRRGRPERIPSRLVHGNSGG